MADTENKSQSSDERFRYIGFEVFPGKPGNIFKSDEERKSLIEKVMGKLNRSHGEVRDRCTLMADRVSSIEKILLTVAAAALIVSLFLPWFSGYHQTVTTRFVPYEAASEAVEPQDEAMEGAVATPDSLLRAAAPDTTTAMVTEGVEQGQAGSEAVAAETEEMAETTTAVEAVAGQAATSMTGAASPEEIPEGMRAVTEVHREYSRVAGIGALFGMGTYGSRIFSSGPVLVITGILMIIFTLSCIVMAILNLYVIYGANKPGRQRDVLYLKKMLRFNWIPVFIWSAMLILSFFGADYGFDTEGMIDQIGDSYGVSTFIGLTSYGIMIAFSAFLVVALKGKEI